MNPIACEEPVSERRDDASANNDRNESRPVHICLRNTQGLYSVRACALALTEQKAALPQLSQNPDITHSLGSELLSLFSKLYR
jgi:hypothetical protein